MSNIVRHYASINVPKTVRTQTKERNPTTQFMKCLAKMEGSCRRKFMEVPALVKNSISDEQIYPDFNMFNASGQLHLRTGFVRNFHMQLNSPHRVEIKLENKHGSQRAWTESSICCCLSAHLENELLVALKRCTAPDALCSIDWRLATSWLLLAHLSERGKK